MKYLGNCLHERSLLLLCPPIAGRLDILVRLRRCYSAEVTRNSSFYVSSMILQLKETPSSKARRIATLQSISQMFSQFMNVHHCPHSEWFSTYRSIGLPVTKYSIHIDAFFSPCQYTGCVSGTSYNSIPQLEPSLGLFFARRQVVTI